MFREQWEPPKVLSISGEIRLHTRKTHLIAGWMSVTAESDSRQNLKQKQVGLRKGEQI